RLDQSPVQLLEAGARYRRAIPREYTDPRSRPLGPLPGSCARAAVQPDLSPAPVVRVINRVVRPLGRRTQEEVPVDVSGDRYILLGSRDDIGRLLPVVERAIGPDV